MLRQNQIDFSVCVCTVNNSYIYEYGLAVVSHGVRDEPNECLRHAPLPFLVPKKKRQRTSAALRLSAPSLQLRKPKTEHNKNAHRKQLYSQGRTLTRQYNTGQTGSGYDYGPIIITKRDLVSCSPIRIGLWSKFNGHHFP